MISCHSIESWIARIYDVVLLRAWFTQLSWPSAGSCLWQVVKRQDWYLPSMPDDSSRTCVFPSDCVSWYLAEIWTGLFLGFIFHFFPYFNPARSIDLASGSIAKLCPIEGAEMTWNDLVRVRLSKWLECLPPEGERGDRDSKQPLCIVAFAALWRSTSKSMSVPQRARPGTSFAALVKTTMLWLYYGFILFVIVCHNRLLCFNRNWCCWFARSSMKSKPRHSFCVWNRWWPSSKHSAHGNFRSTNAEVKRLWQHNSAACQPD